MRNTTNITIRDVAMRAGISKSTASDILNGSRRDLFREDTVEKVLDAARELGYQAHAGARSMRQGKRTLVGIAVRAEMLYLPAISALLVAAHAALMQAGLQPVIVDPEQMVPGASFAPFPSPDMLAGIISVDLAMEEKVPSFYKTLSAKLPIVALYPVQGSAVDCVTTNRCRGIEMAFEHLWELGHRRIAHIESQTSRSLTVTAKITGWKRACRKHKIPSGNQCIIPLDETLPLPERAAEAAHRLLAMKKRTRPSAVICGSDEIALRILQAVSAEGLHVPGDLSLIGFDDMHYASYSVPPLTTVAQPVTAIATAAVQRLRALIELDNAGKSWTPRQQLIAPQIVVRETVRTYKT
jgi:DNA-binding LacI/PurR family transcriptional regulator